MANDVHTSTDPSITSLVTGITDDLQQLIRQQATLVRQEIQEDFRKTKEGALAFALGAFVTAVSVVLFAFTLVYLLAATALPLWACFAIVTAVFVVAAAALLATGKQRFDAIDPMHDEAAQGLRENLQFRTRPR